MQCECMHEDLIATGY